MQSPITLDRRILFLDDDPRRAAAFSLKHPQMVWVQAAEECLALLQAEPWDEVHLDHDLAGEILVDSERNDCGMEIVRWLCKERRPHLESTVFIIHSHNVNAVCMMQLHLQITGYKVQSRPFGASSVPDDSLKARIKRLYSVFHRLLSPIRNSD